MVFAITIWLFFVPNSWNSDYSIKLKSICQQFFKIFLNFFIFFEKPLFDRRFQRKREYKIQHFFAIVNKKLKIIWYFFLDMLTLT